MLSNTGTTTPLRQELILYPTCFEAHTNNLTHEVQAGCFQGRTLLNMTPTFRHAPR